MNYVNDDWLPDFPREEDEDNRRVDGDPYTYGTYQGLRPKLDVSNRLVAIPQGNAATLDINAHHGQVHGSYNYTAHVTTLYHQSV